MDGWVLGVPLPLPFPLRLFSSLPGWPRRVSEWAEHVRGFAAEAGPKAWRFLIIGCLIVRDVALQVFKMQINQPVIVL